MDYRYFVVFRTPTGFGHTETAADRPLTRQDWEGIGDSIAAQIDRPWVQVTSVKLLSAPEGAK